MSVGHSAVIVVALPFELRHLPHRATCLWSMLTPVHNAKFIPSLLSSTHIVASAMANDGIALTPITVPSLPPGLLQVRVIREKSGDLEGVKEIREKHCMKQVTLDAVTSMGAKYLHEGQNFP